MHQHGELPWHHHQKPIGPVKPESLISPFERSKRARSEFRLRAKSSAFPTWRRERSVEGIGCRARLRLKRCWNPKGCSKAREGKAEKPADHEPAFFRQAVKRKKGAGN